MNIVHKLIIHQQYIIQMCFIHEPVRDFDPEACEYLIFYNFDSQKLGHTSISTQNL